MLDLLLTQGIPVAVATIYDAVPGLSPGLRTALAPFNDVILREAVLRRLAQISPAGRRHALQGAAERGTVQVDLQDLALGQVPLQLEGAPKLPQLAGQGPIMRVEQSGNLHRQRAAARHYPPTAQVEPDRPRQRQRVDPWVVVEPAVFVGQQGLQVKR